MRSQATPQGCLLGCWHGHCHSPSCSLGLLTSRSCWASSLVSPSQSPDLRSLPPPRSSTDTEPPQVQGECSLGPSLLREHSPDGIRPQRIRYYRGTHGVIVVYDVTSAESFVNVKRWLHEINQNCDDVCRILVGNKNDDPERKVVETEDAYKFAGQMGIQLFETSAKENINVEEMFNCITELVLRAKKENLAKQQQQQQNDLVKLTKNSKRKKRCC
ncbi:ras-related protein Rab-35 isoform X1 [Pelodiscus sinensis]|uniref:ras-related protein Rab-35 isoform X1 n=1 Tax=Pelodiscus sinensis TaxID=13735 RepID=UPI003F6C406D